MKDSHFEIKESVVILLNEAKVSILLMLVFLNGSLIYVSKTLELCCLTLCSAWHFFDVLFPLITFEVGMNNNLLEVLLNQRLQWSSLHLLLTTLCSLIRWVHIWMLHFSCVHFSMGVCFSDQVLTQCELCGQNTFYYL